MQTEVGVSHQIEMKFWIHDEVSGRDIDDAAAAFLAIDDANHVFEIHRDCACIGAKVQGIPDCHLLVGQGHVRRM